LAIFFGLLGAFSWAGADLLARHVSRRIGPVRTFILAQCVGLAALTFYLLADKDPRWSIAFILASRSRSALEWAIIAATLNIVGSMALYRSFAIGKMALVTPIAASYPALTVVLALGSGEHLQTAATIGIPIVLAGMILAVIPVTGGPVDFPDVGSHPGGARNGHAGVGWALAASTCFGLAFWILGFRVTGTLGAVVPIWIIRLAGATLILGLAARRRSRPVLPPPAVRGPLVASALLDTTGFVATTLGLATGHVSVVTVLTSLFGVVIVLFSWAGLKESLHLRQWIGVALIFAGVALVSL
jgi:drug/metabolite transporter (DMT)-like permease